MGFHNGKAVVGERQGRFVVVSTGTRLIGGRDHSFFQTRPVTREERKSALYDKILHRPLSWGEKVKRLWRVVGS